MIIGLLGYAQSGKDSVAKTLVEEFGFERIAFADKLRDLVYESNLAVRDLVDERGWDGAKQYGAVRQALQDTGMAARKVFGPDFWIKQAMANLNSYTDYVITDVRLPNEADYVKFMGGRLWRVKRPEVGPVNSHLTESALDGYKVDQILHNNGSLEELRDLVKVRVAI